MTPGRIVKYKPLLDEAIRVSTHKPDACLILTTPTGGGRNGCWPRISTGPRRATKPLCLGAQSTVSESLGH